MRINDNEEPSIEGEDFSESSIGEALPTLHHTTRAMRIQHSIQRSTVPVEDDHPVVERLRVVCLDDEHPLHGRSNQLKTIRLFVFFKGNSFNNTIFQLNFALLHRTLYDRANNSQAKTYVGGFEILNLQTI